MNDLISIAEVIKALDALEDIIDDAIQNTRTAVFAFPSAQQWHTGEPTEDGDYLVFDTEEYYTVDAYYTHNGTVEYGTPLAYKGWQSCNHVKYWMPLPEAPEVEE